MFPRPFCTYQPTPPALTQIEEAIAYYLTARGIVRPQPWVLAMNSVLSSGNPAIGYVLVSTTEPGVLQGASGLATTRLQLSCLGVAYQDARTLAVASRNVLQGFSGQVSGVRIDDVKLDSAHDINEPLKEGQQKPIFHRAVDYKINWQPGYPNNL
jgi:hypothetical protein